MGQDEAWLLIVDPHKGARNDQLSLARRHMYLSCHILLLTLLVVLIANHDQQKSPNIISRNTIRDEHTCRASNWKSGGGNASAASVRVASI